MCPTCRYPPCTRCKKDRPRKAKYSVERKEVWTCPSCQLAGKHNVSCKSCGETNPSAFDRRDRSHLYDRCRTCQYPQCSTCEHRSTEIWTPHPKIPNEVYKCTACTTAERQCTVCLRGLPPSAFGRKADGSVHKVCRECQFPTCAKCGQRSTKMSHRTAKENNVYVCDDCRTERICKGRCGRSLPPSAFDRDKQRRMYQVCRECQSKNKQQLNK